MRSKNDVAAQHDATDYALRNRVYQTLDEMERVRKEITNMEGALRDKIASQMLAETRLENRLMRPSPELVRDDPHAGLADEGDVQRAGEPYGEPGSRDRQQATRHESGLGVSGRTSQAVRAHPRQTQQPDGA
ncbi:Tektin-B1 [Gryllus bimaculatus]|nr:Tektin-B1 [Gryllus bimaculatus]